MKKLLLAATLFIATAVTANAQTTFGIAGNVGTGLTEYYGLTAGGDIQADLSPTSGLKFTISGGYQNFAYKVPTTSGDVKGNSGFIPLLGGVKFPFSDKLYGHAQLGYSLATLKGAKGAFTYAPSIGYGLGGGLDLSAKYLGLSFSGGNLSAIVARLAYNFGK